MTTDLLMALTVMLPLIGAMLAFAWPRVARWIGVLSTWTLLPLGAGMAIHVWRNGPLEQAVGGWVEPIGIALRADGLTIVMMLMLSVVGSWISLYAFTYFGPASKGKEGHKARYFWPLWLFLAAALNGLFLSGDLFNVYVTMELQSLSAVALVALAHSRAAMNASLRYLAVGLTGSLLYLMGVALLYGEHATLDITLLATRMTGESGSWLALVLMTAGLLMKGAMFPMHFWLPPAHSSAPVPVSAILSALVVKSSFYILLRIWFQASPGMIPFDAGQLLGALGAGAIVWGSIQALMQERLKLLIAYSTVAQLGYLFLVFPLAAATEARGPVWTGGLIFLLSHATAKSAMFLAAGNIMRAAGHDRIKDLHGVTGAIPLSVGAIGLAGVSLVGLPPTGGFVGKWFLLLAGLDQGQWWWIAVLLVGGLLSAAYMVRLLTHAFTQGPETKQWRKVPGFMEWSAVALALTAFLLGFVAGWPGRLLENLFLQGGGP